uniref:Replication factor A C-terminal domain-containing protein n=1 Tax=Lactuca sativa TaxID=4236 RepID=A0A9R1UP10_LACSA|nr:hypothetical protein LSAT_V11C800428190 [Lactuca sativa]
MLKDNVYVLKTILSDFTFKDVWYHVTCTTCGKSTHKKAVLTDKTDTTTVFMSNEATCTLLNATAQEIIDGFPSQDRKTLPKPLERCKGLTKNVYVECTKLSSTINIRLTVTAISDIKTPQPTISTQKNTNYTSLTPTKSRETGKRLQMEHTDTPKKPRPKREKCRNNDEADEGTHAKKQ